MPSTIVLYAAGALLLSLVIGGGYALIRQGGVVSERQRIERANDVSQERAANAAKNVDECSAAGGNWDRVHGVCVSPGK